MNQITPASQTESALGDGPDAADLDIELNPFGFMPKYRSAILPLGGTRDGPDPKYGFHTSYRQFRPGPLMFSIQLQRLEAKFGELTVYATAFVPESGEDARLANALRIDMAELAVNGGRFQISVNVVPGVSYAIVGLFYDGTDATAETLTITAHEQGEDSHGAAFDDVPTAFGSPTLEHVHRLISDQAPTFGDPVSQLCTTAQLSERSFTLIADSLGRQHLDPVDLWGEAFVLQALTRYGLLKPGARGLMVGAPKGSLPAVLSASVGQIVSATSETDDLLDLAGCGGGYDFLFSFGVIRDRGETSALSAQLEKIMRHVRPGGVAVHIFDIDFAPARMAESGILSRAKVEQITLTLLAQRHDVAQLNFGSSRPGDRPLWRTRDPLGEPAVDQTSCFGMIVRRPS